MFNSEGLAVDGATRISRNCSLGVRAAGVVDLFFGAVLLTEGFSSLLHARVLHTGIGKEELVERLGAVQFPSAMVVALEGLVE